MWCVCACVCVCVSVCYLCSRKVYTVQYTVHHCFSLSRWHEGSPCTRGGFTHCNLRQWCFSLRHWREDSVCTRGGFTHYNLRRWCFSFHPLAQIPDLHSGNLYCVVVVYICISSGGLRVVGCIMSEKCMGVGECKQRRARR